MLLKEEINQLLFTDNDLHKQLADLIHNLGSVDDKELNAAAQLKRIASGVTELETKLRNQKRDG